MRVFSTYLALFCAVSVLFALQMPTRLYAQNAEQISVSSIVTESYFRMLFDVENPDALTIRQQGNLLTLSFEQPVQIDRQSLMANGRDWIANVSSNYNRTIIFIALTREQTQTRRFLTESGIGIDLTESEPLTEVANEEVVIEAETAEMLEKITEESILAPSLKPSERVPEEFVENEGGEEEVVTPLILPMEKPVYDTMEGAEITPPDEGEDLDTPEMLAPEPAPIPPPPKEQTKIVVTTTYDEATEEVTFNFNWFNPVAAAMFAQGNSLVIVFDKYIDLRFAAVDGASFVSNYLQINTDDATIVRFYIDKNHTLDLASKSDAVRLLPQLKEEGTAWQLSIAPAPEGLTEPTIKRIPVIAESTEYGPQFTFRMKNAGYGISWADSDLGEIYTIIPTHDEGVGVMPGRRFVDLEIIESYQGIVYRSLIEGISYQENRESISVTGEKPLRISSYLLDDGLDEDNIPEEEQVIALATEIDDLPEVSLLPFSYPRMADEFENSFLDTRRALYDELTALPREERADKRLEIADFFFANELYSEAIGVLREMKVVDPLHVSTPKMQLMHAVGEFMIGHYRDAEILMIEALARIDNEEAFRHELRLWRWVSNYHHRKLDGGLPVPIDYLAAYDLFLADYPVDMRYQVGLTMVDYYLQADDILRARLLLESMSYDGVPEGFENATSFYFGKIAADNGDYSQALQLWRPITEDIDDRKYRAHAIHEMTALQLQNGNISPLQAVSSYERQAIVWRGGDLELKTLRLIGEIYIENHRYRDGLTAWKNLVNTFPNTKHALRTSAEMKETFLDLFTRENLGEGISPFDVLALYFEFRELTPVGEEGDNITQKLVDYFIQADLLENAISVVAHQLRYRHVKNQRNRLALMLADLELINRHPENVLEALSYMDFSVSTEEELERSKYLRSKALANQGNYRQSLGLLADDFSDEAQDIRLEIFWEQDNWFGIINIVSRELYRIRETNPSPLTAEELKRLKYLATAYAAQEVYSGLRTIRDDFVRRIEDEELKETFMFLTETVPAVNYLNLADTVRVDELSDFVNEYGLWPSKHWKEIIAVLEPQVAQFDAENRGDLTLEQQKKVVRLLVAYARRHEEIQRELEQLDEEDDEDEYEAATEEYGDIEEAEIQLKDRYRGYVNIDGNTVEVFSVFEDRLQPKNPDGIFFKGVVPLDDIDAFLRTYKDTETFVELNEIYFIPEE